MSTASCAAGLACLALAAGGCSVIRGQRQSKGEILFSHSQHVAQADCADCHGEVGKSDTATGGRFIPKGHEGCSSCHEQEIKRKCGLCHRGAKQGVQLHREDRRLLFSHARHTAQVKECSGCHPQQQRGGAFIPGHQTCNTAGCHRATYKSLQCSRCHQDLQRFRAEPTDMLVHGSDFKRQHGAMARQSSTACAQCHDQTYCAGCHQAGTAPATPSVLWPEKVERQFIHRGDFVSRHMIEARAQPDRCYKCHGQRSCRACHALNGLAEPLGPTLKGGVMRNHHPAGWVSQGSGQFHGTQARREIQRCASCHDRGALSNCISCHKVGGAGGNPHPPGWGRRDKTGECYTASLCATCHAGGQGCHR